MKRKLSVTNAKAALPKNRNKIVVKLRLDHDVLVALRESGPGWQSRVNALLRAAVELLGRKPSPEIR